ncbi:MAG TPA: tRNA1(Val) (adenine(37)-N6)-methyltransferase [Desulfosarcina sp.]|nr:tRNA1(Val) (adenine(37)-N6)-methyltransferase [Desulfosarcina sp.]
MATTTRDLFFDGKVVLNQPKSGYRFSIDAVILSHLIHPASAETVLDLGTGCGVIPVMLAYRHPGIRVIGVEIQASLCRIARRNVADNGMAQRVQILENDMTRLSPDVIGGPVDRVVSNPPYRKLNSGRINADSQKAVARHELKVDLDRLLSAARRVLKKSGRLHIIYPSVRAVDLVTAMRSAGLEPKCLTMIHSKAGSTAPLVALVGVNGGSAGLAVTPPLTIYDEDGSYSREVAQMLGA